MHLKKITIKTSTKTLCENVTLSIHPGDIWGILGPNGCGKTSLLHALAGFTQPTAGSVWLGENPLRTLSPRRIAKHRAILFQETPCVFPQTVWEYCLTARFPHQSFLAKTRAADQRIVTQALDCMELTSLASRPITRLSGGEKRRLAIAAVLAQTPHIYLLDEPTNHLDVRHQRHTLRHFRDLAQQEKKAVVITLHDMNLAQQFCNQLLLLFQDGSHLHGPPETVLTEANLSRLYQCGIKKITHEEDVFWWTEKT